MYVIYIIHILNKFIPLICKHWQQPAWKPTTSKTKPLLNLMVSEQVRAVQYGNPQLQDVCQVYGSITCKVSYAWTTPFYYWPMVISLFPSICKLLGEEVIIFDGRLYSWSWTYTVDIIAGLKLMICIDMMNFLKTGTKINYLIVYISWTSTHRQ